MSRTLCLCGVALALWAHALPPAPKTFKERLPSTTVEFEMVYIPPGRIELPDPE